MYLYTYILVYKYFYIDTLCTFICIFICICICICICLRPENRPSVFAFFCVLVVGVGWGNNVQCICCLCTRLLVRCICCIFSLYSRAVACTSCFARHVFCTSVGALHVTLDTSSVLRWIHFILYARHVF